MNNAGFDRIFTNFNKYKSLLAELVRRDIKIKYRRSVLGILWSLLDPLLSMILLTIIFSTLFKRVENYPIYYLTGMTAFTLFRSGSTQAMRSIISSSGIWKVMYVPKYIYVISAVTSNFITYVLSLSVLFGIMFVLNVKFTVFILFASLPILILIIITIGAGLIMATINVFFRDMEHLYTVFCTMLMYAMPIFYPADIVPPRFRIFQTYNPLLQIIEALRDCFLYGKLYEPFMIYYPAICSVVILVIGLLLFYKYQDKFILYV
ncbi:MAG: ABC transporter permease [Methanosphaera sp.]|nr:ABC transporter permease [Methanosphaera sp.]